ncbi:MAG: M15 family metallopeptidase [Deltaproteobacteria bacterium]|nr:M15 family metallopeptidase [Deltaproteobacteria bacterium]
MPIEGLAYLQLSYWGFDGRVHSDGELIVKKELAEEVLAIFQELYSNKFPIEKIRLIDAYAGKDDPSMEDNNTSAFNCRPITGKSAGFSLHSYGTAIDINPRINPYVKIVAGKTLILPANGEKFADRKSDHKGMIQEGDADPCYRAFVKRGWTWGGTQSWFSKSGNRDYQHFEK